MEKQNLATYFFYLEPQFDNPSISIKRHYKQAVSSLSQLIKNQIKINFHYNCRDDKFQIIPKENNQEMIMTEVVYYSPRGKTKA